jgi:hypothetical protein
MPRISSLMVVVVAVVGTTVAPAANNEIGVLVGFRLGGDVNSVTTSDKLSIEENATFGLIYSRVLSPATEFEFTWSRQPTEIRAPDGVFGLDIDYIHAGATYHPGTKKVRPYVAASAGLTRLVPDSAGLSSETHLSLAVGGGTKVWLNDRVGFRFDGRLYFTLATGSASLFCGGGGCSFSFSGGGLFQTELNAGVVVAF